MDMDMVIRLVVIVAAGCLIVPSIAWVVVRLDERATRREAARRATRDRVMRANERPPTAAGRPHKKVS